jgi:hypothetical protein
VASVCGGSTGGRPPGRGDGVGTVAAADSDMANPKPARKLGVPWRRDPVILERLPVVERRHLAGHTNMAIARDMGCDEGTIRGDLRRLNELWLERAGQSVDDLRAQAAAALLDIQRRAIAAAEFDEMCERAVLFGEGDAEVERDHKGSAQFRGNKAAALTVARQAVMDTAKVFGIVVEKVAPTDADGKALDLASLMALAQQRRQDGDGDSQAA